MLPDNASRDTRAGYSCPVANPRQRRIALNEAQFREINEALRESLEAAGQQGESISFVCECGHAICRETIAIAPTVYEAARSNPRRFFVMDGHEIPDAETVVERHDGFCVVEKKEEAASIAEAADPDAA